jgi:hypothetical protein
MHGALCLDQHWHGLTKFDQNFGVPLFARSCKRRGAYTPTIAEEKLSTAAKNKSTQVLYESDTLLAQVLATHYGDASHVFAPLSGEGGILNLATSFHARLAGVYLGVYPHIPGRHQCGAGRRLYQGCRG